MEAYGDLGFILGICVGSVVFVPARCVSRTRSFPCEPSGRIADRRSPSPPSPQLVGAPSHRTLSARPKCDPARSLQAATGRRRALSTKRGATRTIDHLAAPACRLPNLYLASPCTCPLLCRRSDLRQEAARGQADARADERSEARAEPAAKSEGAARRRSPASPPPLRLSPPTITCPASHLPAAMGSLLSSPAAHAPPPPKLPPLPATSPVTVSDPALGSIQGSLLSDPETGRPLCKRYLGLPYAQPMPERWRRAQALPDDFRYGAQGETFESWGGVCPQVRAPRRRPVQLDRRCR